VFPKILKILGFTLLFFIILSTVGIFWLDRSQDSCWKQEAADVYTKYGSLKTRAEIVNLAGKDKDTGTNPVEVIEKDPNGCGLGSNGQTVVKFFFNSENTLSSIEVYKNYVTSESSMIRIEKRNY